MHESYVSLDHTDYIIDIHLQELLNTYAMRMLVSNTVCI